MTETLLAWGIVPVACTRFCEQPDLPHVGGTKDPDIADIAALRPDLVIVDAEENRREDHDALLAAGLDVHVLRIRSVSDVDEQLGPLASLLGVTWPGVGRPPPISLPLAEIRSDNDRIADINEAGGGERGRGDRSAFVPIWRRPYMALGSPTYGSSLLMTLGISNVFAGRGGYPETTLWEAADCRPDIVIAPSEPYPFAERHRRELEAVAPVVFVDGRDLLWWGTRTSGALVRLAAILDDR